MGTRGFVGFVADGKETITYNHWDSYPSGLGVTVLEFARMCEGSNFHRLKAAAADLKHVTDNVPPTRDEVVALIKHADLRVSSGDVDAEWYVLLRHTHGNPEAILSCGYAEHSPEWPLDSLFAEWGYVVDFDTNRLDVYAGFQRTPPIDGRWAGTRQTSDAAFNATHSEYYAVSRVASYDLNSLPTSEEFTTALGE